MIDHLLSIFGVEAIHKVGMVVTVASQVVRTFEQEFAKDHNSKKAAIDAVIELLNKHKEVLAKNPPDLADPSA